jgi:hypothetical protein
MYIKFIKLIFIFNIYLMPDHKVNEVKLLAVEYLMNNPDKTQDEVCEIFQCSRRSLMRWLKNIID